MDEKKAPARFPISVKGVLQTDGRFLLRKNERDEYELLGGRLEKGDRSFTDRLKIEFLEESGIIIQVGQPLEPWVLQIGSSHVLIVPYRCCALQIPDVLSDQDKGQLEWFDKPAINDLPMPQGYKDSILAGFPHSSISRPAHDTSGWIYTGEEKHRAVFIQVWKKERLIWEQPLSFFLSPQELLFHFSQKSAGGWPVFKKCRIDWERDTVSLQYTL